jgi:hypothetical protein
VIIFFLYHDDGMISLLAYFSSEQADYRCVIHP